MHKQKNMSLIGIVILLIIFGLTRSSPVPVDHNCDQCSSIGINFALSLTAKHPVDVINRLEDSISLHIYTEEDSEPDVIVPTNVTELPLEKLRAKSRLKFVIHGFGSSYESFFSQQIKDGRRNSDCLCNVEQVPKLSLYFC